MITYPSGDLLTRIKNAALAGKREVVVPPSKLRRAISIVLKQEGYLSDVKSTKKELVLTLSYKNKQPVVTWIKNVSRPGCRVYKDAKSLPRPLGGKGVSIISTPQGVMSNRQAYKKKLGGEVIAEVW